MSIKRTGRHEDYRMGQAKIRKLKAAESQQYCKPLSRAWFDLYTLGTRNSLARLMAEELSWWSNQQENVLGLVFRDRTDNDFGWNILARDEVGRFRWVTGNVSIPSIPRAREALWEAVANISKNKDVAELGRQGGTPNVAFNLSVSRLTPTVQNFIHILSCSLKRQAANPQGRLSEKSARG